MQFGLSFLSQPGRGWWKKKIAKYSDISRHSEAALHWFWILLTRLRASQWEMNLNQAFSSIISWEKNGENRNVQTFLISWDIPKYSFHKVEGLSMRGAIWTKPSPPSSAGREERGQKFNYNLFWQDTFWGISIQASMKWSFWGWICKKIDCCYFYSTWGSVWSQV